MALTASPAITVSVIVPVYNEIATARQALDALAAKRMEGYTLQLVIIESNSTDGSREVVLDFKGRENVTVILEDAPKGRATPSGRASRPPPATS